jgi:hypothetical protein
MAGVLTEHQNHPNSGSGQAVRDGGRILKTYSKNFNDGNLLFLAATGYHRTITLLFAAGTVNFVFDSGNAS